MDIETFAHLVAHTVQALPARRHRLERARAAGPDATVESDSGRLWVASTRSERTTVCFSLRNAATRPA